MCTPEPDLTIVYRSSAAENSKPRPRYYDKTLALASVLRAAEALPARPRFVFLNDGEVPADRVRIMAGIGDVRRVDDGGNRATFRRAVAQEAARPGSRSGLVWFAEDDYLYRPDSLTTFVQAAQRFPDADYFSLYGSDALDTSVAGRRPVRRSAPGAAFDPDARDCGSATWYRAYATTSTFGVRRGALREDAALLRVMPFTGGAWDTATCLALQGYRPFGPAEVLPTCEASLVRGVARGTVRVLANLRSRRRPARRRIQLGTDPELIWHMEVLTGATRTRPSARTDAIDWDEVAGEVADWATVRSMPVPQLHRRCAGA
ncbi:hypothetical protein GCM10017691_19210 [Pseudonocardia petroleophila]|uniref:Glycosyl transferase family 2 n=1 Tax=Pseudonocardia petroleophila TaxID=37331 RepID=A0A7G7MGZ1_9PSEU|nr:hypothetical protein [Pseudonocardia petroleophila]QNG52052.1 hypothetical protein H6H00_28985 [Pseudonocardia petroleophila]